MPEEVEKKLGGKAYVLKTCSVESCNWLEEHGNFKKHFNRLHPELPYSLECGIIVKDLSESNLSKLRYLHQKQFPRINVPAEL